MYGSAEQVSVLTPKDAGQGQVVQKPASIPNGSRNELNFFHVTSALSLYLHSRHMHIQYPSLASFSLNHSWCHKCMTISICLSFFLYIKYKPKWRQSLSDILGQKLCLFLARPKWSSTFLSKKISTQTLKKKKSTKFEYLSTYHLFTFLC